jgi:single-strand DNA-binding protein
MQMLGGGGEGRGEPRVERSERPQRSAPPRRDAPSAPKADFADDFADDDIPF